MKKKKVYGCAKAVEMKHILLAFPKIKLSESSCLAYTVLGTYVL